MKKPLVSVIVCTYNRQDVLALCLQSMVDQTADKSHYEVIVVNNNSTDDSQEIALEFAKKHPAFRVVMEVNQGLSYARNRGHVEALGDYVAYIDDDAMADCDWIAQIANFIRRRPDVSAFGGPYYAFSLVNIPDWFPPEYGTYTLGDEERALHIGREWINGTNMIFSKQVLNQFHGFKTNLGMKGNEISYGEETRLLLDLAEAGMQIYYVPAVKVRHLVAGYKLSLRWLLSSNFAAGKCWAESFNRQGAFITLIKGLVKSLLHFLYKTFSLWGIPWQRKIYYAVSPFCYQLGALIDYFTPKLYKSRL